VDVKADDARLLMRTLRAFLEDPPPPCGADLDVARTASLDTLYDRERYVGVGDQRVTLDEIAELVHLRHPRSSAVNADALNRALALALARLLHVDVTEVEVDQEIARWQGRHQRRTDQELTGWLKDNHLSGEEFRQLAREGALCRALWRWVLSWRQAERSTRLVLDHLRWNDEYAGRAVEAARTVQVRDLAVDLIREFACTDPEELAREHGERTGVLIDTDLGSWAEEAGFDSAEHLLLALARDRRAAARTEDPTGVPAGGVGRSSGGGSP